MEQAPGESGVNGVSGVSGVNRRRLLQAAAAVSSAVAGAATTASPAPALSRPGPLPPRRRRAGAGGPARTSRISAFDAVNPFIGTELDSSQNKGNSAYGQTHPGATLPFGMVQSGPTTYRTSDGDQKGGYEYTADRIRGFGMTRLSGTGCEGRYSGFDFPVTPCTGALPGGALPTSGDRDHRLLPRLRPRGRGGRARLLRGAAGQWRPCRTDGHPPAPR